MKIFQVITVSEYGGAQTFVANLVRSLSPDNDVSILYGGNGEAWQHLGDNFRRIRLNDHRRDISLHDLIMFFKLVYYRFKYKPDIVHLHSSKVGALGRLAFNKKTIVFTVHGFDSVRKGFRKFLIVEKLLKNRAAKIVGVSKYDVKNLKEEGIDKNVELVYNGVIDHTKDTEVKQDHITSRLEELKQQFPKIVMCISRISKQKKFDLFLDVAAQMPEYAFVWIGNKNQEEVDHKLTNVFCLGEANRAFVYLRYADLFVLPSNYEGLPMSLLEALSFSVPVVASAVGGIPEVLDGSNGFAVDNTTEAFSEKIRYILSDDKRFEEFSKNARQTYLSNFTIEKMMEGYRSVYKQITAKKSSNG